MKNNNENSALNIPAVSSRFWLYRPKYNERYDNVDEATKNEILQTEGGIWHIYTHEPTEKEIQDAFFECYC
jgi:hypothetical protein